MAIVIQNRTPASSVNKKSLIKRRKKRKQLGRLFEYPLSVVRPDELAKFIIADRAAAFENRSATDLRFPTDVFHPPDPFAERCKDGVQRVFGEVLAACEDGFNGRHT